MICRVVNVVSEASSITALTWLSNSTGSTMTLRGATLNSAEPIGTAVRRQFGDQQAALVGGALADQAFAEPKPLRMAVGAVVGIGREQPQVCSLLASRSDR